MRSALLLLASLLLVSRTSFAQQLVCDVRLYPNSEIELSDTPCSFSASSNSLIVLEATYIASAPVSNPSQIRIGSSSGPSVLLYRQEGHLERWKYRTKSSGTEAIWYRVEPKLRGVEHLFIRVWREDPKPTAQKTNLVPLVPKIDASNGDLIFGYEVVSDTPLLGEGRESSAKVYYGRDGKQETYVKGINLSYCEGKSRCRREYRLPRASRKKMALGQNQLIAVVDPDGNIAETSGSDNIVVTTLDNFFIENISNLMRYQNWTVGAILQDTWLWRDERIADITKLGGLDFSIGTLLNVVGLDWVLDNSGWFSGASGVIERLTSPQILKNADVRVALRRNIEAFQIANRTSVKFDLSDLNQKGSNLYRYVVKTLGTSQGNPINPVYAALGRTGLYALPVGQAVRRRNGSFRVRVDGIAVVIFDSFDFEGNQPLGCWPNLQNVLECLGNKDYRSYRLIKKRGGDFIVQSDVKYYPFSAPEILNFR